MSEVITAGIAAGAVASCAAVFGVAVGAGYLVYKGLSWLSEQGRKEMEKLEKELSAPPTHATTAEARREFEERFALVKDRAIKVPTLMQHAEAVARLLALKQSPLGVFLGGEEWKKISQPALSGPSFAQLLHQAGRKFTEANAVFVARSITEVAASVGFTRQHLNQKNHGKQTLVLEDPMGRALVAEVVESEKGARMNLDLAGFGDGSCHEVMDRVLMGLAERDIRLGEIRRRSHYRREGSIPAAVEYSGKKGKVRMEVSPDVERGEADLRRRQTHHEGSRLKARN